MARNKAKRAAARRWGTRFDAISRIETASLASDDTTAASTTTTTTDKAPGTESVFSEADDTHSSTSHNPATSSTANDWFSDPVDTTGWNVSPANATTTPIHGSNPSSHKVPDHPQTQNHPSRAHSNPQSDFTHPQRRAQRWNHNASVFVASLPPEPNAELDTYLRETLGQHGKILNIKFIHDVRAGNASNCAFVQFDHPDEAAAAIQACHMTFIQGRSIRCEPAKAHRTLLVSFCPPPTSPSASKKTFTDVDPRTGLDPADHFPEWVRIRRPDSRTHFIYVTFNKVALDFVDNSPAHWINEDDVLSGPGALISLTQDVPKSETMHMLAQLFGPLEVFRPFMVPPPEQVQGFPYAPHPVTQTDDRNEATTYEIKWEQRQDSISALYCLSRLPNLIVTWAHEHPHPNNYRDMPPRYPPPQRTQLPMTPSRVENQPGPKTPGATDANQRTPMNPSSSYSRVAASPVAQGPRRETDITAAPIVDEFPPLPHVEATGNISTSSSGTWPGRLSVSQPSLPANDVDDGATTTSAASVDGSAASEVVNTSTEVVPPRSHRSTPTPPVSPPSSPLHHAEVEFTKAETETPAAPKDSLPASPDTPLLDHGPQSPVDTISTSQSYSRLLTPSSSTGLISPSPMLRSRRPLPSQPSEYKTAHADHHHNPHYEYSRAIQADSMFVGGLDQEYGWTERKVRDVFEKYGEIESVKIVFKNFEFMGHCFIKYADPKDIAKAIAGENNASYGGRTLRVNYSTTNFHRIRSTTNLRRLPGPAQGLGLHGVGSLQVAQDVFSATAPAVAATNLTNPTSSPSVDQKPSLPPHVEPLPSSDSAPASLGRTFSSTPDAANKPTPTTVDVIEKTQTPESKRPSTPAKALSPPKSRHPLPQTPAASKGSVHTRTGRARARAHSDPATPSSAEKPIASPVDNTFTQPTQPPLYSYPDMYYPYMPGMFYMPQMPPGAAPPSAEAINMGPNPFGWRNGYYPTMGQPQMYQPPNMPFTNHSNAPSTTDSEPPAHATEFTQNEAGSFVPVYGNEPLDQYQTSSRIGQTNEHSNSVPPSPPAWSGMSPPFSGYPSWAPPLHPMASMGQVPMPSMVPPFPPASAPISEWDSTTSTSVAHMHMGPQYPSPVNPSYMHASGNPVFAHPGSNPSSVVPSPMPAHFRPRPAGKRQPSHHAGDSTGPSGHGPTLQQMIGINVSKKQNGERYRQQHAASNPSPQSQGPSRNTASPSSSSLVQSQYAPTQRHPQMMPMYPHPYSGFPMPYDPAMGAPPFMMMPHHTPRGAIPAPMQWNVMPAAYDNP